MRHNKYMLTTCIFLDIWGTMLFDYIRADNPLFVHAIWIASIGLIE